MLIVALIGALASLGIFARHVLLRLGVVVIIALVVVFSLRIGLGGNLDTKEATNSFIGKLARSTDELSIQEYPDLKSINLNWRGYETARAFRKYASGDPLELAFGYGCGALVDVGLWMPFGNIDGLPVRYFPILHNGYAYLLVKGGAIAIALFGYAFFGLYRLGSRTAAGPPAELSTNTGRLMQGSVVILAFTTWLVAGVFSKLDLFPYLLLAGFLIAPLSSNADKPK
jgi:hypothetical protein